MADQLPSQSPTAALMSRLNQLREWQQQQRLLLTSVVSGLQPSSDSACCNESSVISDDSVSLSAVVDPLVFGETSRLAAMKEKNETDHKQLLKIPPTANQSIGICHAMEVTEIPVNMSVKSGIEDISTSEVKTMRMDSPYDEKTDPFSENVRSNSSHVEVCVNEQRASPKSFLLDDDNSQVAGNHNNGVVSANFMGYSEELDSVNTQCSGDLDLSVDNLYMRNVLAPCREVDKEVCPKFKFLKKGEGTSRFRMKSFPRLKKSKVSSVLQNDEISIENMKCGSAVVQNDIDHKPKHSDYSGATVKILNQKSGITITTRTNLPTSVVDKSPVSHCEVVGKQFSAVGMNNTSQQLNKAVVKLPANASSDGKTQLTHSNDVSRSSVGEHDELCAFEQLEQLADDSSFASNSSTVMRLLQRGLRSVVSTPIRNAPPLVDPQQTSVPSGGEMVERCSAMLQSLKKGVYDISNQQTGNPLNLSLLLKHLKEIVLLPGTSDAELNESDLEALVGVWENIESISPINPALNLNKFAETPLNSGFRETAIGLRPHVHFPKGAVEVMEFYEQSDSDESTLADATSLNCEDSTDLLTSSDLQILETFHLQEGKNPAGFRYVGVENVIAENVVSNNNMKKLHSRPTALKLQFSPPKRPANSASHLIWSIFSQDKPELPRQHVELGSSKLEDGTNSSIRLKSENVKEISKGSSGNFKRVGKDQDELESLKILLMSKVIDLEQEIEVHKKESAKCKVLENNLKQGKLELVAEKERMDKELIDEKEQFHQYVEKERNRLWKERVELAQRKSGSVESVKEQSLELVYLQEQVNDLKAELKKNEAAHSQSIRRMTEKIRTLERENEELNSSLGKLGQLQKENLSLKQKLAVTKTDCGRNKPRPVLERGISKTSKETGITNKRTSLKQTVTAKKVSFSNLTSKEKQAPKNLEHGHLKNKIISQQPESKGNDLAISELGHVANLYTGTSAGNVLDDSASYCGQELNVLPDENENTVLPSYNGESLQAEFTVEKDSQGNRHILYANGNKKIEYADGSVIMSYYNGDIKETHENRTIYIYSSDRTRHTSHTDGTEILEFPNGQKETHYPDGSLEVTYPNHNRKTVLSDGQETFYLNNGTIVRTCTDGERIVELPGGQREIHKRDQTIREWPDGTVKVLHSDGRLETRYINGRVRIKDHHGHILSDMTM